METVLTILVPLTFLAMLGAEQLFPARRLPNVKGWLLKGIVFFLFVSALSAVIPAAMAHVLGERSLFDLRRLGTVGGAIVAFLAADVVIYFVHRLEHNVPFLWRWSHQMHHSAERLDVAGSSYFHPFDITLFVVTSTLAVAALGVTADAAALAGFGGFVVQTFQHLNVRTPQWVGFVIQRPEAHAVHHARGVHAYNYGNFMLWDIVLGTFRNPATFSDDAQGFWDGASRHVGAMLLGRDVSEQIPEGATK